MSKRENSKKAKQTRMILNLSIVVLIVVSIVMMFVPTLKVGDDSYKGYQVIFGYEFNGKLAFIDVSLEVFKFSFLNLLPYLLLVVSLALVLLQMNKANQLFSIIMSACCIVAGIMFLLVQKMTVLGDGFQQLYEAFGVSFKDSENVELLAGPIVSACCSFGAGLVGLGKAVLKK